MKWRDMIRKGRRKVQELLPEKIADEIGCLEISAGQRKRKLIKNARMGVVFLVTRIEIWSSVATVYRTLCRQGMADVHVLILLNPTGENLRKFVETWEIKNYTVIGDGDNGSTIIRLHPDYIFLSSPYEEEYKEGYHFCQLRRLGKICYVPYGYNLSKKPYQQKSALNDHMLSNVDFLFASNRFGYDYCKSRMKYVRAKILYNVGYPRFDLIETDEATIRAVRNILWLPRWNSRDSTFLTHKEHYLEFAVKNKNVKMTIRPHPLMYRSLIEYGLLSREEYNKWQAQISNLIYTDDDPDYHKAFEKADILIGDYSSLLAEFFLTTKPIIYFGETEFLSDEGKDIYNTFYQVKEWGEAEKILSQLMEGHDEKREDRIRIRNRIRGNMEKNAGEKIANIIQNDFFPASNDENRHACSGGFNWRKYE